MTNEVNTISNSTDAVSAVFHSINNGKFFLRRDSRIGSSFADVLGNYGQVIGSASQIYSDGGWAVQTLPFGGYVSPSQVIFVSVLSNGTMVAGRKMDNGATDAYIVPVDREMTESEWSEYCTSLVSLTSDERKQRLLDRS